MGDHKCVPTLKTWTTAENPTLPAGLWATPAPPKAGLRTGGPVRASHSGHCGCAVRAWILQAAFLLQVLQLYVAVCWSCCLLYCFFFSSHTGPMQAPFPASLWRWTWHTSGKKNALPMARCQSPIFSGLKLTVSRIFIKTTKKKQVDPV